MGRGRDLRILLLALAGGAPGAALSLWLLWRHVPSQALRFTLAALVLGALLGCALVLQSEVVRPLQRLANLLAAIREGDYSLRAGRPAPDESFGAAMLEASAISELMRGQRFESLEAAAFLGAVMAELEVAVFAFDGAGPGARLRLANRAGALLFQPASAAAEPASLLGRTAESLGLEQALAAEVPTLLDLPLPRAPAGAPGPGPASRWEARTRAFHQGGVPHRVLVLSDLRRSLREEERLAWQRLIRVLSHEINNSLTPIQSIAQSLQALVGKENGPARALQGEARLDLTEGLQVIGGRAEAVGRFMAAYAKLARLPAPRLAPLEVGPWVRKVALLEGRAAVCVEEGPQVSLQADRDQLEQVLINLLHNAAEACAGRAGAGRIEVGWRVASGHLELWVRDDGPGLPPQRNLFVPFFTTKQSGSGIGLLLSRQIAEAHGGELLLRDRAGRPGAEALLRLALC